MKPAVERVTPEGGIEAPIGVMPEVTLEGSADMTGRRAPSSSGGKLLKMMNCCLVVLQRARRDRRVPQDSGTLGHRVQPRAPHQSPSGPRGACLLHRPERRSSHQM